MTYNEGIRVLYISYDGMTDPLGQSQVIPYLRGLAAKGNHITLMSFEKGKYKHLQPSTEVLLKASGINWIKMTYHNSPSLPATLWDLLTGSLRARTVAIRQDVSVIHCRGHYILPLMAAFVRYFRSVEVLFDMRGFWADERIDGRIWNMENPLHRSMYHFFKRMEKRYLSSASQVVVLTTKASSYLEQHFPLKKKPVVIPCAADLDLFTSQSPDIRSQTRNRLGVEDKFVLCYHGSVGTWYMIEDMLRFFKRLLAVVPRAHFLFITKDDPDEITKLADKLAVDRNDYQIMGAERIEIPVLLSAANAAIFFITPLFSKLASSPTKHGEILGCGLPLICNSGVGDVEDIVTESRSGVLIHEFTDRAYDEAIQPLLNLVDERPASRCRDAAEKYYSLQKGVESYDRIYRNLTEKASPL